MAKVTNLDDQPFDQMFKTLLIGNSGVGKTCLLIRYCNDAFSSAFTSTVGIDFQIKMLVQDDRKIKLQIWDTAGQERYRTITTAYYRSTMGFILMYDITNEESFKCITMWADQIKNNSSWEIHQVVLVGNKCDMEEERKVSYEQGQELADSLGYSFFETSAKENVNVAEVFDKIAKRMIDVIEKNPGIMGGDEFERKSESPVTEKKGCAC